MLCRTFLFLPGVDEKTEHHLWQAGCRTWWHLLERDFPPFSSKRLTFWRKKLEGLSPWARDLTFWAQHLPRKHHWRLLKHFSKEALFLDIETNGLKKGKHEVTVLGVFDGRRGYQAFVAGENLEEGLSLLEQARFWVTFGGSFFDWPFLKSCYPWLPEPLVHLDLCRLFRRLGLRGGLKKIEKQIGLKRPGGVEGLDGYAAVKLWCRWRKCGDGKALEKLIAYNREDVVNLLWLAELVYFGLTRLTLTGKIPALRVSSRKEITRWLYGGEEQQI